MSKSIGTRILQSIQSLFAVKAGDQGYQGLVMFYQDMSSDYGPIVQPLGQPARGMTWMELGLAIAATKNQLKPTGL